MELEAKNVLTNAPYWAYVNKLLIDGRPFDLEGRAYQAEIMKPITNDGKVKTDEVIRKGSQIGITMGKVIEITHGALHSLYPQGIIYYFPSEKAVQHFSATRFKPFIIDNEEIKQYCNDINAVSIRRIGKTNVNFFGLSATVRVGGEAKDSNAVRSTPADWILLDERDMVDQDMAAQVNQRLGNSKINRRTDLGTPKLPDDGVDLIYGRSDMRRWIIKCRACGKYTCMESDFPNCIGLRDGGGFPKCVHCGKEIHRSADGQWVADYPKRDVVGYWVSQLLNPNRDLAHALKEYADPETYNTTAAEFQRTVMGLPYVSIDDRLYKSDVYACCCGDQMAYSHDGPCAMGVDIGNVIHVVIGHRITKDRYKLVKMARVSDYGGIHDLAKRFNVKSCVIDSQPDIHAPRTFQKEEPYAVYLCRYSDFLKTFDRWNPDTNMVEVNRTEIFDATHHMTRSPGNLMIPRQCEEVNIFAHQMTMTAKYTERDKRTGDLVARYKKLGDKQDHYRNALNYFFLACKKVGIPETKNSHKKTMMQDMEYHL